MIHPIYRLLWLSIIAATAAAAQPADTSVIAVLRGELTSKKVPGGAVGVIEAGRVTCLAAVGYADNASKIPANPEMLFRLGSTTKMFVATAALLAANEGRLDLDASIQKYIPGLPPRLGRVTMRQILTHTAGIQDEAPMYGPADDAALEREIGTWTDERVFLQPGESFSYSNPGYWLAGRVLEKIDRKHFADLMRDRVLRPLGMNRSTFRPEVASKFPLALPHDQQMAVIDPAPNHAGTWPSGSLYSSVPELLRFASALLNDGMLDGKRILPSKVVKLLLQPQVGIKPHPGTMYGFGLVHKMYRGMKTVYHSGSRTGYGSIIDLAPEKKVAVVVVGNRTGVQLTSTVKAGFASRIAMGELAEEVLTGGKVVTDPEEMKPYIGMYVNRPPIEIEIYNRSALPLIRVGEILTLRKGQERIPLRIIDDSTATNGIQQIAFTRSADGVIRLLHYDMHTLKRSEVR